MDVVITTAQVPAASARLVTAEAVGKMKPGSVLVDMAAVGARATSNCRRPARRRDRRPRDIIAPDNLRPRCPRASVVLRPQYLPLLLQLVKDGALDLDPADEIEGR